MTSFLQDKQLTIALCGEIDHHSARETMGAADQKALEDLITVFFG